MSGRRRESSSEEFLGRADLYDRAFEIPDVSGDETGDAHFQGRVILQRVFKVGESGVESQADCFPVHGQDGHESAEFFQDRRRRGGGVFLAQDVKEIRVGERRDADLKLAFLGQGKESGGRGVEGFAAGQQVQDDIGVDKDDRLHRYLSAR